MKIALAGNPNSGKSTIFNLLTGLNQKVANFPGVTVEEKRGSAILSDPYTKHNFQVNIIDLPGTYSLYPKALDEQVAFQVLCGGEKPDLIVMVADGSNLKRSLFLCTQIIDLQIPVVLAINMMDIVESRGYAIHFDKLSKMLGIPVVPLNARKKSGVEALKSLISSRVQPPSKPFLEADFISEKGLKWYKQFEFVRNPYHGFLLMNNNSLFHLLTATHAAQLSQERIDPAESKKLQAQETLERYKKIGEVMDACFSSKEVQKARLSAKIDKLLTHRVFGFLFFLLVLFLIFQAVFSWSQYPMEKVEEFFIYFGNVLSKVLPPGIFQDLLINGILAGLSGILVFVPQIALLFLFISLLEDSGYMARVSFITDRLMRKFGLNGKSVIPLISGAACAVPAIMSARTIGNWKERITTIMVTPLMSCSARIPVYTLLIALVIPDKKILNFFNLQGLTMLGLYLLGFIMAIFVSFLFKIFLKSRERSYFIMEMPDYKAPRLNNIGLTIFQKVRCFAVDAGKIIIAISIVLWFLSSYGPGQTNKSTPEASHAAAAPFIAKTSHLSESYAGHIGKMIEPVIKPLGFDWKVGIALITSFAAREVFVGTMATIYAVDQESAEEATIREKMKADKDPHTGLPIYTLPMGLSLIIFYAFAMQCMSTLSVVYRETNSIKWPLIQLSYLSILAYLSSFLVFQIFG